MIRVGHYNYTGSDDFSGDAVGGCNVKNLHILNDSATKTNTFGLDLHASVYAEYRNLHLDGCRNGFVVQVVSGWLSIKDLLIDGTGLAYGARVYGEGFSSDYNSTGLDFSGITAINFTVAGFSCEGNAFGDINVGQLVLYGGDAGAIGVLLNSTGDKHYANKIQIHGIEMDGTAAYALYSDGVSQLQVMGLTSGGAIAAPWYITGGTNNIIISNHGILMSGQAVSDPAAPEAGHGILYLRDNGAGKKQFVARFPSGAVQAIATEP